MISISPSPVENSRALAWPDLSRSLAARAIARAFTPPPDQPLWQWADENVLLQNEDAAEPGEYRSAKTPWTRRIQDLMARPEMWVWNATAQRYEKVPVQEISVQKSSQSGFSEACLNGIRWRALYRPCNVIYAIDSADEARKIANRLLRSLEHLDAGIFTGDPADIKTLWFALRGMDVLFYGSFSPGKFANKQAPLVIADEVEEHDQSKGDTTTLRNLGSRKKTSTGGLQINLSKPKLKNGPINKAYNRGNREACCVPCPHCGLRQPLTFFAEEMDSPFTDEMIDIRDEQSGEIVATLPRPLPPGETRKVTTGRLVFEHCKDIFGKWDKLRILRETYFECAGCKGVITERAHKRWMLDRLTWLPTTLDGTPGFVSQQMSDLLSEDELSAWGQIVLDYLDAKEAGFDALQGFYNHRLGKVWSEEKNVTEAKDILGNIAGRALWLVDAPDSAGQMKRHVFHDADSAERLVARHAQGGVTAPLTLSVCPPYKRGTLPWTPLLSRGVGTLLLGADVGGNSAKWVVAAVHENMRDIAVVDWGEEIGPDEILTVCNTRTWLALDGKRYRVLRGFIDCRYRTEDVYRTCIASRHLLIPTVGIGGAAAASVKLYTFNRVPEFHRAGLHKLDFNKQRSLDGLYRDRIKLKRARCWFPVDVADSPEFIDELCAEHQEDHKGRLVWSDEPIGPNHSGDALGNITTGLAYLTRPTGKPNGQPKPETPTP